MRYVRELKRTIGEICSKRENECTTLPQYWVVDTCDTESLGILIPTEAKVNIHWLKKKLISRGYFVKEQSKVKNCGRQGGVSFHNLVVKKLET